MSYSNLKDSVYLYLGYKNKKYDESIDNIIDECLLEVEKLAQFKYMYMEFNYLIPLLEKEAYQKFLKGSTNYYLCAMTLGRAISDKIRYYSKSNMHKMVIFDACASAYLEYLSDKYQNDNLGDDLSFRFCPGYGNTSVNDLKEIVKYLDIKKIGIELLDSCIMIPEKSMIGIIYHNKNIKKSCEGCIKEKNCDLRKDGITCYKK